jgi:hypothetical protein
MTARRTALLTAATAAALGVAGLAAPAAGAATPSPTAAACDRTAWEAKVQGAPAGFRAGSPSGDYLWHAKTGFHLRVTHAKHDTRVYTGVVHASAPMRMERVKLEKGDHVVLSKNRRTILFAFANHGYVDGIDFHTDCATSLTVSGLHVGSHRESHRQVYLGAKKAHPARVPFTVHRTPVAAA